MTCWLVLVIPLLLSQLCQASGVGVFPDESNVPQCTTLEASWDATPPIHLHVQPGSTINVSNLVDLGVLDTSLTSFMVALPIGQQFSFAFNTLADPFTVYTSDPMTVTAGTADCLGGQSSPRPPPITPQTSTATTTPSAPTPPPTSHSTSTSSGGSGLTPSFLSATNASTAVSAAGNVLLSSSPASVSVSALAVASPTSGSSKAALPIAAVVGPICALFVVIFLGLALFWVWHRRSMRLILDGLPEAEAHPTAAPAPNRPSLFGGQITRTLPFRASAALFALMSEKQSSSGVPATSDATTSISPNSLPPTLRLQRSRSMHVQSLEEVPPAYGD
ncbi:hypothetical protein C8F04DRAFT_1227414 [Mycena alexandri]|uniref:Uncharacterized protein n=1 Tax=Mycena alexandri TaxID=1745969 RepID=A0AAD6XBF6_9AGAR|nr:hypothetical protein C8F04DRAFT_1227414 [Mycena alexandri]